MNFIPYIPASVHYIYHILQITIPYMCVTVVITLFINGHTYSSTLMQVAVG